MRASDSSGRKTAKVAEEIAHMARSYRWFLIVSLEFVARSAQRFGADVH